MAQTKDEAFYEAQAAEAARKLAQLRLPKLEAALASVEDLAARLPDLVAQRDALPADSPSRRALANVLSILTSAPGIVRHEIASLPKEPEA